MAESRGDRLLPYGPYRVMLLEKFNLRVMEKVAALQCTKDDVLMCAFPKSGTTWTEAITMMILNAQGTEPINPDVGHVQLDWLYLEKNAPVYDGRSPIEEAMVRPSPRTLRTHLACDLLPPTAFQNGTKIIFVHRRLKDVMVSMYEMIRNLNTQISAHSVESFDQFAESFMKGQVIYAPYFHHFQSFWEHRDDPNFHHLSYEALHEDAPREIRQLAKFLGKSLTEQQIQQIAHHTTFENMSKKKNLNKSNPSGKDEFNFMRKGVAHGWRSHISEELSGKIDLWAQDEAERYHIDVFLF